jgi:hypothetical protein
MALGPFDHKGVDLVSPINRLVSGRTALSVNVRSYIKGGVTFRNLLSDPIDDAVNAATASENTGTVTQSGSGIAWTNPSNIFATSPSIYTQISITGESLSSQILSITDLGFAIPAGATITGIGLTLQSNIFLVGGVDITGQWTQNGAGVGNSFNFDAGGSSTYTITAGGLGQLFGYGWTTALINGTSGLGLNLSTGSGLLEIGTIAANLNNLVITVYYNVTGPLELPDPPHSIRRLNDSTPNGPASGYVLVIGAAGKMYVNNTQVASGLSDNPVSLIPFRPNTSVQPWMYWGDSAPMGNVTLDTKYLISGAPVDFVSNGMGKSRSDGLTYKMGIEEPQLAPVVSTTNSEVTTSGTLEATAIPWTNYQSANSDYDYGETNGNPDPTPDGTAPYVVDCANASFITINSITGTATVNGNSSATPTTSGPVTNTHPAYYIQAAGTGHFPPASATIITGAFTDGDGHVIPVGVAPLYVPSVVDVGAVIGVTNGITVPYGAQAFQIGIDSAGNTFHANSGSFSISTTVTTDALPTVTAILGTLALYYWGDTPVAQAYYSWKNPGDPGGGTARTISDAVGNTAGNSFILDASFGSSAVPPLPAGIPGPPGAAGTNAPNVPMQWFSLSPESAVLGSSPVFPSPITATYPAQTYYNDFNFCLYGKIYIPAPGHYTFVLTNAEDCIWGIQDATLISATATTPAYGAVSLSSSGQTITVAQGYRLLPRQQLTAGFFGEYAQTTVVVSFAAAGIYGIEIDYNYGIQLVPDRILLLEGSPVPGPGTGPSAPTIIPPLPIGVRENTQYRYTYRSSATGATSNPSPESTAESVPVLANTITSFWSPDPQVDVVDYYRLDSVTSSFTYVNTGPNDDSGSGTNTPVTDSLTDTELGTQLLNYDNYEPFPSIDLPQKGICNVSGGVITWVSGGAIGGSATGFNIRWLAGTEILIGSPTSLEYTFIARPTSSTQVTIPGVPDGTNLTYEIPQPILAAQPLPYLWGPTDNINYAFGVGDPLRAGTLYWCAGSNLDSAPDTNQQDLTDPGEPLVNGAISGGLGVVFSIKRAWLILPNFFNALATVTGTEGSTWSLQESSITRGLYIPRCVCVSGGGNIYFRVDDGIHVSRGGASSISITDDTLYPIFSHESEDASGDQPVPVTRNGVTIYPPDDTLPELQHFSYQNGYMYYDYQGVDGNLHTLVFDEAAMGWEWDITTPPATIHAANEGPSQQGVLVGCDDGSVRQFSSVGTESATAIILSAAIGGKGFAHWGEAVIEYSSTSTITLNCYAADVGNGSYGPPTITLPSTGGQVTKYFFRPGANKWKLLWAQFSTTAPFQLNFEGTCFYVRSWGSSGEYQPIRIFGSSGGEG